MSIKEVQIAQLVVLLFIGIIFWKGYKQLNHEKLKVITYGWTLISIVFLFDILFGFLFLEGNTTHNLSQVKKCILSNSIIFDLLGGFLLLRGSLVLISDNYFSYIIKFLNDQYTKTFVFAITIFLTITLIFITNFWLSLSVGILYSILMFFSLYSLHYYLKELAVRYNGTHILVIASKIFAIIQLFAFIILIKDSLNIPEELIISLFFIGLISKIGILYGLIDVFVKQNQFKILNNKNKAIKEEREENIREKSRVFHDILLLCDDIERSIDITLKEDGQNSKIDRNVVLVIKYINNMNLSIKSIIASEKRFEGLNLNDERIPEIANLNTLVQLTIRFFSKEDLDGIKIDFRPGSKANITCIPSEIIRIIQNLIKNSREAIAEEKSGKIFIETTREQVDDDNFVLFTIKDNGRGINESIRDLVWELGFSTKDSKTISGIGLTNVKEIVEKHNAKIELTDGIEGKGVGFLIRFPHVSQKEK